MPTTHERNTGGSQIPEQATPALAQETHDLVRHLGDVVGLRSGDRVLLLPGDAPMSGLTLAQEFDCQVTMLLENEASVAPTDPRLTVEHGSVNALPFADGSFDAVIVATPILTGLYGVAQELARVLARSGRLGMVALSPYRDQVDENTSVQVLQAPVFRSSRPAAAYRSVLGEAGFTAFLTEDRRREVRRSAAALYREHMLQNEQDTALSLLAQGGLSVTLITAEKGL